MTTKQNAPNTEDHPLITKINMAGTIFDISTTKDWSENDSSRKGYIENRTHYIEEITTKEDNISGLEISHEFLNTYTKAGDLLTSDTWQVNAPWFILNEQFNYELSFRIRIDDKDYTYTMDGPVETKKISISDDPNNPKVPPKCYLDFKADTCTFSLVGEEFCIRDDDVDDKAHYPKSVPNTLTLKACKNQSYNLVHQLGAEYIPIDNDTIRRTNDGKLFVDDTFSEDFYTTTPFGKYEANSWVSAKGKSAKEVIFEAFCEDLQPEIVSNPEVYFEITPDVANGVYELGTKAKLNWTVSFNPGKYSYGTTKKNDSNLYIANIKLCYKKNNDANSIINEATYQLKNGAAAGTGACELGDHNYDDGTLTIFCPQNPNGGTYVVAEGKASVPITTQGLQGSATLEVKCVIDSDDYAATIKGEPANPVKVFETNWAIDAGDDAVKKVEKQSPDFTISEKGKVYGAYRWFCGYSTADNLKNPTLMKSEDFRNFISNGFCLLEKFPEQIKTTKMQQLFFAAPLGAIESDTFKVFNNKTGAFAGKIYKCEKSLKIANASGESTYDYDVFYISNAKADSGTNTYTIEYKTKTGGTN